MLYDRRRFDAHRLRWGLEASGTSCQGVQLHLSFRNALNLLERGDPSGAARKPFLQADFSSIFGPGGESGHAAAEKPGKPDGERL